MNSTKVTTSNTDNSWVYNTVLGQVAPLGKLLVLQEFGSHVYGTNTPNSDRDYKAVYIANPKDILMGNYKPSIQITTGSYDTRNTKNDIDIECIELRKFTTDFCNGQTYALDMLYTPASHWIFNDSKWLGFLSFLLNNGTTKNTKPLIGYCMQQAGKYGIKGSRLESLRCVLDWIEKGEKKTRLRNYIQESPFTWTKHVYLTEKQSVVYISVLGKLFPMNICLDRVQDPLQKMYREYNSRSLSAKNNIGIDWKAISHAYRCCYQLLSLARNKCIIFPLPEAPYLRSIKNGSIPYASIADELPILMQEAVDAMEKSMLPSQVNKIKIDTYITNMYLSMLVP